MPPAPRRSRRRFFCLTISKNRGSSEGATERGCVSAPCHLPRGAYATPLANPKVGGDGSSTKGETSMRCISLLTVCLLAGAGIGAAQDKSDGPKGLSKEEADQGFVSLFDGKTLAGWKGATEGYTAEEGMLVCQKKGGGNLFTAKEFGD